MTSSVAFCVATQDAQRGAGRRAVGLTTSRKGALMEMEQVESESYTMVSPGGLSLKYTSSGVKG